MPSPRLTHATRLTTLLAEAGLPVEGVADAGPRANPRFVPQLSPQATAAQRDAAAAILEGFDPSDAAQAAWEAGQAPGREALRGAAPQAIADLDAYAALNNPNPTQTAAQVRRQAQILALLLRGLDLP
jgi:hypothetical protein